MKRKWLFLILLLGGLVSCQKKKKETTPLREALSISLNCLNTECYFPLVMESGCNSIRTITEGRLLYHQLSIYFCDYETFAELLADEVEKNGYLYVDSVILAAYESCIVVPDKQVDSIYQIRGIKGVLENFVSKDGILVSSSQAQENYLIDLLYQHRILSILYSSPFGIYVDFTITDNKEEYKQILKNSTVCVPDEENTWKSFPSGAPCEDA